MWSDDVPGLVLSHTDVEGVLQDIPVALKTILSYRLGGNIEVSPLDDIREALEHRGIVNPVPSTPHHRDYVAFTH